MKKNNTEQLYGLILIGIGIFLLILVGGPMLLSLGAILIGFYLINYGLLLTGNPSLPTVFQRFITEIRNRFF